MKKMFLIFVALLTFSSIRANDAFKVSYEQTKPNEVQLVFELGEYSLTQTELNNKQYTRIAFEHSITTNKKGYAELPYVHASIELLNNKNVSLEVEPGECIDYQLDTDLIPSRGAIYRNQNPDKVPYTIDPSSITNKWYPQELANSTDPYIIKDKRGINVFAYPFIYNAKKKVLRVYKTLKVKLKQNSSTPINPIVNKTNKVLPEMQSIYQSIFINYEQSSKDDLTINQYGDILVVTTARDEAAIEPYIQWKKEKGFNVEKQVVATGTNAKSLIQERYDANNNILYAVLVGDWADIKSDVGPQSGPMDPQLGCVVGSDNVADIAVGRISSNQASDVTVQVNKFISYEQNPELNADWYSSTLGVASDEGGPTQGKGDDMEADTAHQRVIYGDKLNQFTYTQFHQVFDPGATASDVATAVESGVGFINYTGHGSPTAWSTSEFSNSDVNNLTNGNKMPFIVSVACNNGDFHTGTCFAEAWVRKENGGAVTMLAASISQDWDPPMRGQDYIADIIIGGYNYDDHPGQNGINTTEQRSFLGSIVFNAFVLMTSESNGATDWETVKTWNIFGDPTLQFRTEAPHQLNLSNNVILSNVPFETTVTQGGNPVKGAQICISKDGNYFSGITDASGFVSIVHTLEPGSGKLVVTSFNSTTIYEDATIVPPNGAYVLIAGHSINDATGNNNQLLDFNETVLLNVNAKNVGNNDATSVNATISTTDAYITINDNSHSYGDIASNATVDGADAFSITLADNVPDQHPIEFNVEFTGNSDDTWNSSIFILANAPEISIGSVVVNDASGNNNGILDPGETADLEIQIENIGHASSVAGTAGISTTSSDLVINNASQNITEISTNGTLTLSYSVTANAGVNSGTPALVNCEVNSGSYTFEKELTVIIGEIPEFLMTNGTFEVCTGKFMDTGGEDNDYQLNENYVITFKPIEANHLVEINFTSFNIEDGYDYMYIYDGVDINAPQIGSSYTGSNSPDLVKATNSEGALTVKFTSDDYQNAPGWVADISCKEVEGITTASTTEEISIYPNPANSLVNLAIEHESVITIWDLTNRLVLSKSLEQGLHKIDISNLNSGTYLINITNNKVNQTRKLVVK